jgi:hypothetical protein
MTQHLVEKAVAIAYFPRFREYSILMIGGGPVRQLIAFCPWCGATLPPSLRKEWFAKIRSLGLEPEDDRIPPELLTDAWWRESQM